MKKTEHEEYEELLSIVGDVVSAGHMDQEHLARLRAHLGYKRPFESEGNRRPTKDAGGLPAEEKPNYFNWNLHPRTADLVLRFSYALAGKLAAAEKKYGYSDGWADSDWLDECREKLMEHVAKGDPRDVAAYCAFLWHHGASTAGAKPSMHTIADLAGVFDEGVKQGASLAISPAAPSQEAGDDAALLDYLETLTVNVRLPLRYGSLNMFWSSPEEVDGGESGPSDIRAKLRAAMAATTSTPGEQA